jgi:hypothetical protein
MENMQLKRISDPSERREMLYYAVVNRVEHVRNLAPLLAPATMEELLSSIAKREIPGKEYAPLYTRNDVLDHIFYTQDS